MNVRRWVSPHSFPAYHMMCDWHTEASPSAMWSLISRVADRPQWWPSVTAATISHPGNSVCLGMRYELRARILPIWTTTIEFAVELSERDARFESRAIGFDVTESWNLFPQLRGTQVRHCLSIGYSNRFLKLAMPRLQSLVLNRYNKITDEGFIGMGRALGER